MASIILKCCGHKNVFSFCSSTDIGAPTQFVHVQHFGPYQPLNPDEMPIAGTTASAPGRGPVLPGLTQLPSSSASFHSFSTFEETRRGGNQERLIDQDLKKRLARPITEKFQDFSQ